MNTTKTAAELVRGDVVSMRWTKRDWYPTKILEVKASPSGKRVGFVCSLGPGHESRPFWYALTTEFEVVAERETEPVAVD